MICDRRQWFVMRVLVHQQRCYCGCCLAYCRAVAMLLLLLLLHLPPACCCAAAAASGAPAMICEHMYGS
jgi:hypothetical protein